MTARIIHPIPPFYSASSRVLILGSFPSVKSRESMFFYGHPQNRFWKLMALMLEGESSVGLQALSDVQRIVENLNVPQTVEEKKAFLQKHNIALWDSIHACDIMGSSDSSIRNVEPSDLRQILEAAEIKQIFTNGKKSHEIYTRYCRPLTGRDAVCLPSTSPANAAYSLEKLAREWEPVRELLIEHS